MGNRICGVGRRRAVEERLTRPQRLVRQPSNVDYKKLRKLILSKKLAPCFDALEDPGTDLEECPICFFYYPSLNRSRCCAKGICTECFLQMKPSNTTRPAQCPFCKTSCYAVEYRGARTKEEKELEQAEEQKVIEAKIRMQSQEPESVEQAVEVNRICSMSDAETPRPCLEEQSTGDLVVTRDVAVVSMREDIEADSSVASTIIGSRFVDWDVDLEEIMVMEAIWQSLQDSKLWTNETPQVSVEHGGVPSVGDGDVNQTRACPSLDQCETSSSGVYPSERLVEVDDSLFEAAAEEPIGGIRRASYKACEDSIGDGTGMCVGCPENCCLTEHATSWRSVQLTVETCVNAEAPAFATERFSSSADTEMASSCSNYVHSVSSSPCESPNFSNQGGGRGFPQLPNLIVERPMMIVMESSA